MKYFIITGASKGLGNGLAIELLNPEHHLICISRSENQELKQMAAAKDNPLDFFLFDLSASGEIPGLFEKIFKTINTQTATGIYLVNNAGVIQPVARAEDCSPEEVDHHMRVNLIAPMLISGAFIRHTQDLDIEKRILNISSGAAHHPYYGWSNYCTGKAGLEMFGRCLSEEQKEETNPVKTMAVAPGIIDTQMQTTIRGTSKRDFIHRDKFVSLKEEGQLVPPALAGKKLARLLLSADFEDGKSIDIR
ncbi:MAG: (S)-benzoin forming benzil reductase [Bacteroidota bacterium]